MPYVLGLIPLLIRGGTWVASIWGVKSIVEDVTAPSEGATTSPMSIVMIAALAVGGFLLIREFTKE